MPSYTVEGLLETVAMKQGSKKVPVKASTFLNELKDIQGNVDTQDKFGNTLLHWAALYKYEEVIKSLLEKGANPNLKNKGDKTPYDIAKDRMGDKVADEIFKCYFDKDYSSKSKVIGQKCISPSKFDKGGDFAKKVSQTSKKEITV